ncbi:ZmpA/ZmpB/ZmpC family metallo-endopeptidase-related protein, partial [Peptoniphilus asaccharolyticus]
NATNVKPNGKSYITKKFKGTLTSTDGNRFAIHNLSNPLFDVIENSTIKDLIFAGVNINKPFRTVKRFLIKLNLLDSKQNLIKY